jgi:hypothetical protein
MTTQEQRQNDRRDRGEEAGQRELPSDPERKASEESFDIAEDAAEEEALDDDEDVPTTEEDR